MKTTGCRLGLLLVALLLLAACGVQTQESVQLIGPTTAPYTATPISPTETPTPMPVIQVGTPLPPAPRPPITSGNAGQIMPLWEVNAHDRERVFGLAFSPDGRTIATAGHDNTVALWEAESGASLMRFAGHSAEAFSVAFSPDGSVLASGANDGTVRLWEIPADGGFHNAEVVVLGSRAEITIAGLAFLPGGGPLVAVGQNVRADDRTVMRAWEMRTADDAPSGTLAAGLLAGTIEPTDLDLTARHENGVLSIAAAPDGTRYATGSYDRTVRLWTSAGDLLATWDDAQSWVTGLAFSPDGSTLARAGHDGVLSLLDAATGMTSLTVESDTPLWDVAYSPSGALLATVGGDGQITLWQVTTGQQLVTLPAHDGAARAVAFSPDGSLLASTGDDGQLRVWAVTR